MQGNAITKDLISKFNMQVSDLDRIDIIVSFIKKSGFEQIEPLLIAALEQDIPIRVLTSTYMSVTDPIALSRLLELLGEDQVKLYNGGAPSFHPKAYFFRSSRDMRDSYVLVGSSNVSKPALTNGVEWNYQVNYSDDSDAYLYYQEQFEDLFNNHSYVLTEKEIKDYRDTLVVQKSSHNSSGINKHYLKHRQYKLEVEDSSVESLFTPNQVQDEALFELEKTRSEGSDKALVIAATGIGKTFLAAFDSLQFESVLFVAHRNEILNQAYNTFAKVRNANQLGKYYEDNLEIEKSVIFASVQTLSKREHLMKFNPKAFSYIVIDEFHHASANSYRKVLDYFEPKFLLGLTATPHRLDKKDVFQICDYNVPYEVNLFSAINRDWLVPFYYYGIHDDTVKYDNIRFLNGKYVESELSKALAVERRSELVYKHYKKHRRKATIGFCVDINHAEATAEYFKRSGIKAATIHSDLSRAHIVERKTALKKLESGDIDILFAVDMLNEGIDVPNVDLLLFLRPTQSPTVFLQQLGRGLRHAEGKNHLKVLDFIGNYRNVELLPFWLSGKTADSLTGKIKIINDLIEQIDIPDGCYIDFDLQVIDLFEEMFKSKRKIRSLIQDLYIECKLIVEHIPSRLEFFEHLDDTNYNNIKKATNLNPFRDYLKFLNGNEEGYIPEGFMASDARKYLKMIETTNMQALYKIAVLKTFYNNGKMLLEISREQVQKKFFEFYQNKRHWPDLERHRTRKGFRQWKLEEYWSLAQENPIHFLSKTHDDIFEYNVDKSTMRIKLDIDEWLENEFFIKQVYDCIEFRRVEFLDKRLGK